ncbi:MAG: rhodanese-like domain-containing protein [Pseudobdellovibrionaceae bacterium]
MKTFFILLFLFLTIPALATEPTVILDVRTEKEYKEVHIPEVLNIDFYQADFKNKIEKLDKAHSYRVYCRSGNRSGKTVSLMKSMGFTKLENLGSLKEAGEKLNTKCQDEGGNSIEC